MRSALNVFSKFIPTVISPQGIHLSLQLHSMSATNSMYHLRLMAPLTILFSLLPSYLRRSALAETGGRWNCALGTECASHHKRLIPAAGNAPKGQNESVPNLLSIFCHLLQWRAMCRATKGWMRGSLAGSCSLLVG